jgi:hypothetical protein
MDISPTADSGFDDVFALKMSEAASDCAENRLGLESSKQMCIFTISEGIQIVAVPARLTVVHHNHRGLEHHDGGVEVLWLTEGVADLTQMWMVDW